MRLKTESEIGLLRVCEARALRAHKTLTPRFTDFFTDFAKKTDCFAVYGAPKGQFHLRSLVDFNPLSLFCALQADQVCNSEGKTHVFWSK